MGVGAIVTLISAETGAPAVGVDVLVNGSGRYRTDSNGQIRLAENMTLPVRVEASSAEYLVRQTALRPEDTSALSLWPRQSPTGLDESLTRTLVYTEATGGAPGALPLRRLQPGKVSIQPAPAVWNDAQARAALETAARSMSRATHDRIQFVVETLAMSPVVVRTLIDRDDPAMGQHSALTYRYVDGSQITGARVVFASLEVARNVAVVTHELGHAFGLEHSNDPRDLMYPMVAEGKWLSDRESLVVALMLQRRPGNRFPDNDPDGFAAMGRYVDVVSCGSRVSGPRRM
jgi:hypothetical protein